MAIDKNKDDFGERKDFRRKHLRNKFLDKKEKVEDNYNSPRINKENKKRIEQMRQEELWEDWEDNV
jgi:hypothetical protein